MHIAMYNTITISNFCSQQTQIKPSSHCSFDLVTQFIRAEVREILTPTSCPQQEI